MVPNAVAILVRIAGVPAGAALEAMEALVVGAVSEVAVVDLEVVVAGVKEIVGRFLAR